MRLRLGPGTRKISALADSSEKETITGKRVFFFFFF